MNDMIDFLKSLILTTIQVDKKYREALPGLIAKIKNNPLESDLDQGSRARKKKAKKMKLGKDGLWPSEDDQIRQWWCRRKPAVRDDDSMMTSMPQETKLMISCLRSRETQLQMILILEILALESLKTAESNNDSQLPGLPSESSVAEAAKDAPKKRNKHNLPMLLDVLADRLSIWQSVALDEVKIMDGSQSRSQGELGKTASDPLKDFCVDIIIPL
jgi:DNA replication regulator SLD3